MSAVPQRNLQARPRASYDPGNEASDDMDTEDLTEKDATELELERRVFGDEAGFYEALRLHKDAEHVGDQILTGASGYEDQNAEDREGSLRGVNDADVGKLTVRFQ